VPGQPVTPLAGPNQSKYAIFMLLGLVEVAVPEKSVLWGIVAAPML